MTKSPPNLLHRIARGNSPWISFKQTKFQERFDDPDKKYFVLYGCSERVGCFVECLAYFRESSELRFDKLDDDLAKERTFPAGMVPQGWCSERLMQSARAIGGVFADVAHSDWIAILRDSVPGYLCRGIGYPCIDQSTIYQTKFRPITQWMSRALFEDPQCFAGIFHTSRHGSNFSNWAIFEGRVALEILGFAEPIKENDKDLLVACDLLRIQPPRAFAKSSGR